MADKEMVPGYEYHFSMTAPSGTTEIFHVKHPKLQRGKVWCAECGRSQEVDSREAMRTGWPKCCGYTMTIDSPEER